MRTVFIVLGGIVLLGLSVLASRYVGSGSEKNMAVAAQIFIPVWLAVALTNMWIGVTRAGYSVGEELPIMLLIFALPAAFAGFVWWKFS